MPRLQEVKSFSDEEPVPGNPGAVVVLREWEDLDA